MKKIITFLIALCAFTVLGTSAFAASVLGDANGDGNVTSRDAVSILKNVAGIEKLDSQGLSQADVDSDGNVTAGDAVLILQKVSGIIKDFPAENPSNESKTLVVYFSASGNTKNVAEMVSDKLNADVFEIIPKEPYTDADLNWTDPNSRVVYEHDNPNARNVELDTTTVPNWENYDTVLIGYPIWWQIAAWPVDGFVKANDFTGKTVVPFCTSSSSGIGESGQLLASEAGTGSWVTGKRFSSRPSESDITEWLNELGI